MATDFNINDPVSSPKYVSGTPEWVRGMIDRASQKFNIPTMVLSALLKQESGFNPNIVSPAGAIGLAQFMPGTAQGRGVNPLDPESSVMGAAQYLSEGLNKYGDLKKALAAYNSGFGAVDRYDGIPPYQETQNYVKNILAMAGEPHQSANGPYLSMLNDLKTQSTKNTGLTPQPSGSQVTPQIASTLNNPAPKPVEQQSVYTPPPMLNFTPPSSGGGPTQASGELSYLSSLNGGNRG